MCIAPIGRQQSSDMDACKFFGGPPHTLPLKYEDLNPLVYQYAKLTTVGWKKVLQNTLAKAFDRIT